jgi:hypothetical protein
MKDKKEDVVDIEFGKCFKVLLLLLQEKGKEDEVCCKLNQQVQVSDTTMML